MTRIELNNFINAILHIRSVVSDEIALESTGLYPKWKPDVEYEVGDRVLYNGILYKVLTAHTSQASWTPDYSAGIFAKVLIPSNEIPEWEQPSPTNAYMTGDKVTYEGITYISLVDNNVWNPTAYGWEVYDGN